MKNSRLMHGLLWGAVVSAMTVLPAYANTAGVNAILEAAAGKATVPAPATPTVKTTSVKKPVPPTPTPAAKAQQHVLIGPVHVAPSAHHPAVTVPAKPTTPHPTTVKPAVPAPHPVSPAAVQAPSHPVTPLTMPTPSRRMSAPEMPQVASHAVTAGYINPFMGTPGTVQKLSNKLSILQLQTKIAKARASYAKYDSEANSMALDNSPQLRSLEQTVAELRGKMQALTAASARAQQVAHQVQKATQAKRAQLAVVAILDDQGQRGAVIQVGKNTYTVKAGSTLDGHLVQAVDPHQVILGDGTILKLSSQIGHYQSTSWKGHQNSGQIASPQQSNILTRLASEAKKDGIRFNAPPSGGVSPDGMPILRPGMVPG
ncbi:hypothetical protein [Acidithiobacillus thiooxidans]|uniref:Type IV pilus biogenesis protein PilP n=1 Tax=Acidithiobacillus thiooxidans ATCC 19377 TaxID=637390 RepID=A0A543Q1S2_ACITH|nr:hypothetical protein [Acidithiobacillus thiooxidans]MDX5935571.1 hypothetical protein [Acidithiobacillus thiooxidans]TQN50286.1 hypothetical protein DLNHIDIE_00139 [Acidithiobacillus thiooxidans ATCC 19377]